MPAITNINQLQAMNDNLAGNYWLANDIDASATSGWNGGAGFVPIGQGAPYFTGIFDGKGHTISDLSINRPATNYIGLFGYTDGATITDVTLANPNIIGKRYTGALIGYCEDTTISDITVTGASITGQNYTGGVIGMSWNCTATDCSVTGTVTSNPAGTWDYGGFAGYIQGTFERCNADVYVNAGDMSDVGGFVGICGSAIFNQCYASGNVMADDKGGGFVGEVYGSNVIATFTDCYARGNVHAADSVAGFICQVVVWNGGHVTLTNCYSTGAITSDGEPMEDYIGGFMCCIEDVTATACFWDMQTSGTTVSAGGTGKITAQMKNRLIFIDAGWDFVIIWGMNGITNDGYPFFWTMPPEPMLDAPRATVLVQDKITLESIRNIEMAARGKFRIDEEGRAVYRSRYARNP